MAIGTDSTIEFFGTQDEIMSIAGAAVSTGNFSDSGDFTQWTNDDDAPWAMLIYDFTMGGNPTAGTTVDLYARLMNISDTTQDQNAPDSGYYHMYMCSFPMDSGTTAQIGAVGPIKLPNTKSSQVYDWYVENNSGQNLNTGSTVDIVPVTFGPHA